MAEDSKHKGINIKGGPSLVGLMFVNQGFPDPPILMTSNLRLIFKTFCCRGASKRRSRVKLAVVVFSPSVRELLLLTTSDQPILTLR